jgi:hypothetical protein
MKKHKLLFINSILICLGFILSACSQGKAFPEPETASGVYVHSGFEYYRWEEGLQVMIWHDGINHLSCSSSTNGQYEIECLGESMDAHTFAWRLVTKDRKIAQFIIDDQPFDLGEGSLFIINSSSGETEVTQLKRDLGNVQADAGSVTEFGLSDPDILAFIQTTSEIRDYISDCISSSTFPSKISDEFRIETAKDVLMTFFKLLHEGKYSRAENYYGGDYEVMWDLNPSIAPDDHTALFRNACTVNGAQCLEIRKITFQNQPSPAEFRFFVEFSNEDGSLYSRDPCCGDDDPNHVDQTEFIYTVRLECTGNYKVLELPVFGP